MRSKPGDTRREAEKKAINMVRTDHNALTLDKFLNQERSSCTAINAQKQKLDPSCVIPIKLMSVKKLVHAFEQDGDPTL